MLGSRIRAVGFAALTVLGLVGTTASSSPAVAASAVAQKCATITAGGQSYSVSATHVSCSFADKWATALAGKRLKSNSASAALSKHPPGYQCRAGTKRPDSSVKVAGNVQIAGNCAKGIGLGSSPYFNWSIQNVFG
jgi:hypothetical protein